MRPAYTIGSRLGLQGMCLNGFDLNCGSDPKQTNVRRAHVHAFRGVMHLVTQSRSYSKDAPHHHGIVYCFLEIYSDENRKYNARRQRERLLRVLSKCTRQASYCLPGTWCRVFMCFGRGGLGQERRRVILRPLALIVITSPMLSHETASYPPSHAELLTQTRLQLRATCLVDPIYMWHVKLVTCKVYVVSKYVLHTSNGCSVDVV